MKRFLLLVAMLFCANVFASPTDASPPAGYNVIETSYTQTTISQDVVFNSTMQAGGTLTFTVNATSGGGIAGHSEPVSLSLVFYNSSGGVINTVNSGTTELPTPSAGWITESLTVNNCGGSCANVAYVQVQMHGIDGSYWAGDYGPEYYDPKLTFNGGPNIIYNPQFGPDGSLNVQGWASTAGWGVCQGAYGGSNDCVVNNSGVVANGGNIITTAGTPSAPAGGTPAAPTVVSTTTTNSTKTIIVGGQQETVTTPTTTTTYSDGSTTTSTGSATTTTVSNTAFTGVHFGSAQVADTQWNVYACLYTTTCQIYSTNPGGSYNTGSWTPISSTQYITFIPNTGSDSATYPWLMILVNSDGTFTSLGSCYIAVQGIDNNGNIYLFVTNANYNGTLLSGNLGLSGQGVTFTGTQNPTMSQTNTLAGGMSSSPLAAGQTGGTGGSSGPTVVSTQNTTIITTSVINGTTYTYNQPVTITNYSDGSSTTVNNGSATLVSTTLTGGSTGITSSQQTDVTNFNNNVITNNGIYIKQSGNNDTINIQQIGTQNLIGGVNQQYAQIQNGNNNITIKQGNGNPGKNEIDLNVVGGSNTLNLTQGWDTAGVSAGSNYQLINVDGTGNSITTQQSNNGGAVGHFLEAVVNGNYNTVGITQSNDGQKQMFASITGNSNTVTTTQSGTGNHYLSVSATGNGNSAVVSQSGNTANSATINLINNGAPASVNLTQTGGQSYSITQTCVTTCGTVTVRQGN